MKCSAIDCKGRVKFKFPSNVIMKKKWLTSIGRTTFLPKPHNGLCIAHFNSDDIITESYRSGYKLRNVMLKSGAIPRVLGREKIIDTENFNDSKYVLTEEDLLLSPSKLMQQNTCTSQSSMEYLSDSHSDVEAEQPLDAVKICEDQCFECADDQIAMNESDDSNSHEIIDLDVYDDSNLDFDSNVHVYEEEVCSHEELSDELSQTSNNEEQANSDNFKEKISTTSQTVKVARYAISDFKEKPKAILHFTGLESYDKFMTVLYSLGPGAYNLKYLRKHTGNLDTPNQLFLVLWKLRRYASDLELSEHFNVPECAVGNIFKTWILFMSQTWSLIDTWPSRELINFYMPQTFKNYCPTARLIVDGTEIKTDGSSNPDQKQTTFSYYKNSPTMKVLIGGSPGGLISYVSPAYSGSTSDRQIIERSDVTKKCQRGDTILADKGFLVQDIFAPFGVTIATPTPAVTGTLPHKTVLKDRKLSKHRVHVERFIGLLKTFTILSRKLNHYYAPLTSEIVGVCVMLSNFKENIMKPKK